MFVDQATIHVKGGAGGAGAMAFRREKGVPFGGPSGGDGGSGGDVVLVADAQLHTLLDYSYRQHYKAGRAGHGEGSNRTGADGDDLILPVPRGTVVMDAVTEERVGELLEAGERLLVAKGGRGGRGNAAFATPTRQAPRHWEPGEWGEERSLVLELKLIADVGLVGEPNAGKSTLLAAASSARPKVAAYPFTTLEPNLGVVELSDARRFVIADIPGLIEGAHEGKGLGTQFLRHIERTRTLALLVPVDAPDLQSAYELLRRELLSHDAALGGIPFCVLLTKVDLLPPRRELPLEASESWGVFELSSVTREGLPELLEALWKQVQIARRDDETEEETFPDLGEWSG
jgi:GTP-binding protein